MRPDIAPGGTFPDYELPDHASVPRRLSELQDDDPLIWDLGAPGLLDAWEAGDLSDFHGWNKWSPERVSAARSAS